MTRKTTIAQLLASASVLAGIGLGGCENITPTYDVSTSTDGGQTISTAAGVTETRVLYGGGTTGCVFAPSAGDAAVGALLIPSLIDTGLTTVKDAINAAGGPANATLKGYLNLSAGQGLPKCVSVISGHFNFGTENPKLKKTPPNGFYGYTGEANAGQWEHLWQILNDQDVHLGRGDSDAPDFYFEAQIVSYSPPSASPPPAAPPIYFKLVPTFIAFDRPADDIKTVFRPHAVSDLTVTISVVPADGTTSNKGSSASIDLGYLPVGQRFVLNKDQLACLANSKPGDGCAAMTFVRESQWVPFTAPANQPMILTASVVEARTSSAVVKFIGTAFGSAQSGFSTAAQDALIPSKGRADEAAAIEADSKITTAYTTALQQTSTDLSTCAANYTALQTNLDSAKTAGLRFAASLSVKKAMADEQNLNGTAIAAKMPAPYSSLITDPKNCQQDNDSLAK